MKTLLSIIIFLFTFVVIQAQPIEHEILAGQITMNTDSYEIFVDNQEESIILLQFENINTEQGFFQSINHVVNIHDDIRFFRSWFQHKENKNVYMSALAVNKYLFILYYSHDAKRLIIRSIDIKIE